MAAERSRHKEQAARYVGRYIDRYARLMAEPACGKQAQTGARAITLHIVLMILCPYFIQDGNIQREHDTV